MTRTAHHPLYRGVALPYVLELPVLGVPTTFETNTAPALSIIAGAFEDWKGIDAKPDWIGSAGVHVRIVVEPGDEGGDPGQVQARTPNDDQMLLYTAGSIALADAKRQEAVAYVTTDLAMSGEPFRHGVLDALTLWLLTRLDRQPVHAAGIVRRGIALLLAGASGVGKSTLALAASRAGCDVLSDDAVYVQLAPALRVWGLGRALSLTPAAREHFPDLDPLQPVLRANGKMKLVVPNTVTSERRVLHAARAGLCLLERGSTLSFDRITASDVVAHLLTRMEPGFDRFAATIAPALERIAAGGAWRLRVAGRPADAWSYLDRMLDEVERD